jgi:long-chain acyl-CoA synthetase
MNAPRVEMDILARLAGFAERRAEAVAVASLGPEPAPRAELTYRSLARATLDLADRLRADCPPGAAVVLCAPNRCEVVPATLAVLAAGLSVFPLHADLAEAEIVASAESSGARAVVGDRRVLEALAPKGVTAYDIERVADLGAGRPGLSWDRFDQRESALLVQSSGTTGRPKIVRRPGPTVDAVARNVAEAVGLTPDDRVLAAIPLCHSYGVENGLVGPVFAGSRIITCHGFEREVAVRALEREGVTVFPGVPFMYQILAGLDRLRPQALRKAYSAGAALPPEIAKAFRARTGVAVGQLYGASEIGSVTFGDPDDPRFDPASVGTAMTGVDILVVDAVHPDLDRPLPPDTEGQVAIRAVSMLKDYVDTDEPALANGFFLTGDLGRLDRAGNLFVTGRVKLQIDVGGRKVNPLEVEQVLCAYPGVKDCVVVPLPVSETVNRLRAIIALEPDSKGFTVRGLRRFARTRLSGYKVPRVIEVRDALPTSATGKVQRRALAQP